MRRKLLIMGALLALAAAACADNRTEPIQPDAGGGGGNLVVAEGQSLYSANCTACHGDDALGVEGLGKSLVNSEWIQNHTDEEVSAMIIAGRDISDPENTTGVAMPARGGNSALTDDEIDSIVVYLRTLN